MAEDVPEEYLSAEELRDRLYQSMHNRGFINSIKKQIRSNLVTELQHTAPHKTTDIPPERRSLLLYAANSLVAEHLCRCQYDYTLSVFLPECCITADKVMTTSDLLQLLHISPQSRLYRKLANNDDKKANGFLWQLLAELCSLYASNSQETSTQTQSVGVTRSHLDEKLLTIEDLYQSKRQELTRTGCESVEDRILAYQAHLDERARSEVNLEMARFREGELTKMRLEEKDRVHKEMAIQRSELEKTYQVKCAALQERERNSMERMEKDVNIQSREVYAQRQSLLQEIDLVREREAAAKRREEACERERRLVDERVKSREDLINKREQDLKRLEKEYDMRLNNEMTKFRLEEQAKFLDRNQNLDIREVKLKENERRIKEDIDKVETIKDEVKDKAASINQLETQIQESRYNEGTASRQNQLLNAKLREMVDYGQMKEENAVMRHELDDIKMRLSETLMLYEKERTKNERLMRNRNQPNETTLAIQRELDAAKDSLIHEKTLSDQNQAALEIRLHEETARKIELTNHLEQLTTQQRDTRRHIDDLTQQLMHARNALNSEVFRKGKLLSQSLDTSNTSDQAQAQALPSKPRHHLPEFIDISSDESETMPYKKRGVSSLNDVDTARYHGKQDEYGVYDSDSLDMDVVLQAKYRLKSLDRETESLQQAYAQLQYRMTNVHSLDNVNKSDTKHRSSRSKGTMHTPEASPIKVDNPPLSSTPYKKSHANRKLAKNDDSPHVSFLSPNLIQPTIDPAVYLNIHDDYSVRSEETNYKVDDNIIRVSDLEERSGSPDVKVIHGSATDTILEPSYDVSTLPPQNLQPATNTSMSFDNVLSPLITTTATVINNSSSQHLYFSETRTTTTFNLTTLATSTLPMSATTTFNTTTLATSTTFATSTLPTSTLAATIFDTEPLNTALFRQYGGHAAKDSDQFKEVEDIEEVSRSEEISDWKTQLPSLDSAWKSKTADMETQPEPFYPIPEYNLAQNQHFLITQEDAVEEVNTNDDNLEDDIDPVMREYMKKIQSSRGQTQQDKVLPQKENMQDKSVSEVSVSEHIKSEELDVDFDDW